MVEVTGWPPPSAATTASNTRPFQPHRVTAGTEREPVEIDPAFGVRAHSDTSGMREARVVEELDHSTFILAGARVEAADVAGLGDRPKRLRLGRGAEVVAVQVLAGGAASCMDQVERSWGDESDESLERLRRCGAAQDSRVRWSGPAACGTTNQPRGPRISSSRIERAPAPSETTARRPALPAAASTIISPPTEKPMPPTRPSCTSWLLPQPRDCSVDVLCLTPTEHVRVAVAAVVAARVEEQNSVAVPRRASAPAGALLSGSGTRSRRPRSVRVRTTRRGPGRRSSSRSRVHTDVPGPPARQLPAGDASRGSPRRRGKTIQ